VICGLVNIEFCKLVLGLESNGREAFLNSNINLAAGSGNFTTYCPDPPIQLTTGLKAPYPEFFTSWDKIEIVSGTPEMSVASLVEHLEKSFGVTVDRIYAFNSTIDQAIFKAVDKQKLDLIISFDDNGKPVVSEGVYALWPQIRMAVQMLSRLPPESAQRKIFAKQVDEKKNALENVKATFVQTIQGPVSKAYRTVYEPAGEKDRDYFFSILDGSDYIKLGVHCTSPDGSDIHLPCIKYIHFNDETAVENFKRPKLEC
jgi:hypothetical protein